MPRENKVRIVSNGTTQGTYVSVGGERVPGVVKVTIDPMTAKGGLVRATIEVVGAELDITAYTETDGVIA